jgi:ketosteroid isomerase-like protein
MSRSIIAPVTWLIAGAMCAACVADNTAETQALLDADRAWAVQAAAAKSVDSVLAYWTDDARVAMPGQPTYTGKDALRQMVSTNFGAPGFHITWTPDQAVVSKYGDMGYTSGTNEFTIPDRNGGKPTKLVGRYLTVWRKENGKWRCVMDYSTPNPTTAEANVLK